MEITIHVRVCAPFPHSLSAAEGAESLEMMTLMLCMTKFMSGSREVGGGSEPTTTPPGKFELTQFT